MKLIKLSTCLICLGTIISGLSVTAMESDDEYVEQNQITVENNNSEKDQKKDQDEKFRAIYEKEISEGRSEVYAKMYAKLTAGYNIESEDMRRRITEAYEKDLKSGIKVDSAKELSVESKPEQKSDNEIAWEIDLDAEINEKASDEAIRDSFKGNEEVRHRMIVLYNKKRKEGRSKLYSVEYVRQFYTRRKSHNRSKYADKLADLFERYVRAGLTQKNARRKSSERGKDYIAAERLKRKKSLLYMKKIGEGESETSNENNSLDLEKGLDFESGSRKNDEESPVFESELELGTEPPKKMQKIETPLEFGLEIGLNLASHEKSETDSDTWSETESETETETEPEIETNCK